MKICVAMQFARPVHQLVVVISQHQCPPEHSKRDYFRDFLGCRQDSKQWLLIRVDLEVAPQQIKFELMYPLHDIQRFLVQLRVVQLTVSQCSGGIAD